MHIADTDLLLIEDTSGVTKKITALKLKENLAANTYNNHKLLVNKPDYSSRFVYAQNMQQSVAPTDYMLVERSGTSYKVTGDHIIDYFPTVPAGSAGAITDVVDSVTTSSIVSVDDTTTSATVLTFATNSNLSRFQPGDVVQTLYKETGFSPSDSSPGLTFSEDEKTISNAGNTIGGISKMRFYKSKGQKVYWELDVVNESHTGVCNDSFDKNRPYLDYWSLISGNAYGARIPSGLYPTWPGTCTLSWALDAATGHTWLAVNGVWTQGNPSTMTNALVQPASTDTSVWWAPASRGSSTTTFRDTPKYSVPTGFDFIGGDVTVKVVSVNPSTNTMVVDGGAWIGSDGTVAGQDLGERQDFPISLPAGPALLTVQNTGFLPDFVNGDSVAMVNIDGDISTYTPATTTIKTVVTSGDNVTLFFNGSVATDNKDLKFYRTGDIIQSISTSISDIGFDPATAASTTVFSDNDRTIADTGNKYGAITKAAYNPSKGRKIYWEFFSEGPSDHIGLTIAAYFNGNSNGALTGWTFTRDGNNYGAPLAPYASTPTWSAADGAIIGFACDTATGNTWIHVNGVYTDGTGDPSKLSYPTVAPTTPPTMPQSPAARGYTRTTMQSSPNYPVPDRFTFIGGNVETENYKVIAVDTTNNSMTVDGGYWTGTDGTSNFPVWNQSSTWSSTTTNNGRSDFPVTNAFDGDTGVFCASAEQGTISFTLPTPLSGNLEILANNTGGTNSPSNTLRVFSDEDNISGAFYALPHPAWTQCGQQTNITKINNTSSLGGNGSTIYAIRLNGEILVDAGVPGSLTGDTAISGPVKSGTGNFESYSSNDVTVSNSNGDWISTDNRLGEEFFIRAASTRTGLAVLRAKAIAASAAWSSGTNYSLSNLVQHDGHYWAAVVDNSAVTPATASAATWIDLGAI